jgi:DNA helicase MCM8
VNPQIVEALEASSVSQRNLREERISQQFGSAPCKNSLSNRLRVIPGEDFEPLHPILLRKYIAYARKYVCPKLTKEASKVIQDFYLSLRTNHRSSGGTPITTRQLESLIRLSEAKAKVEMREEVTEQDALDVIEIMKESLFDRFENEFGNLDFRRSSGMSMTKEVGRFLVQLQKISSSEIKSIFTYQELQQVAKSMHLQIANFEDFIDILNTQAHLIKKGPRVYKLMT